uniref:Uncharacterized protein n=1 Tax=Romanomermis culicivorax TaxID=13658 RepID=A0A915K5M9_ROMCU
MRKPTTSGSLSENSISLINMQIIVGRSAGADDLPRKGARKKEENIILWYVYFLLVLFIICITVDGT